MKKLLFRKKNPVKLSWPTSAKSDKFFIQKEKHKTKIIESYHGP